MNHFVHVTLSLGVTHQGLLAAPTNVLFANVAGSGELTGA